jgi:hypothetical protein
MNDKHGFSSLKQIRLEHAGCYSCIFSGSREQCLFGSIKFRKILIVIFLLILNPQYAKHSSSFPKWFTQKYVTGLGRKKEKNVLFCKV